MVIKSDHAQTIRKRNKPPRDVYARFGRWEYTTDAEGNLKTVTGHFSSLAHVMGAARHLELSRIRVRSSEQFHQDPDGLYSLELTAKKDNMTEFERFAAPHDLLPEYFRQKVLEDASEEKIRELAFSPAPAKLMEDTVKRLSWLGTGGPQETGLQTTIQSPEVAFQVAYYLKTQGMMDERQFQFVNQDVKSDPPGSDGFRIVVAPEQGEKFKRRFPESGVIKPTLKTDWVESIVNFSHGLAR